MEQTYLASLSAPVLSVHADGQVRYLNPAAAGFWQLPPGSPRGLTLAHLFGAESSIHQHVQQTIAQETSFTIDDYRLERAPGEPPAVLQVQIDPVLVPHMAVDTALILLWDQTRREHLANTVQEERVMDVLGTVAKHLAHELQNPLSGIKGATQLLARQIRSQRQLREYPEVILNEIARMERLVVSLLGHGSEPPLRKNHFNIHELLDTVIWFQANSQPAVTFERDYDPSLPELNGDRDRLHQVFLNLMQNAADAAPPESKVTVRTRMVGPWGARRDLRDPTGTYFQIEIEDRGDGIKPEHLERLFTPYFTTKAAGTGLGLTLSYQIVRGHGGLLRYLPAPGGGTIFAVTLPLERPGRPT